jgi:iron-sulfur cluster repair protein YtfE (RIC family)
MRRDHVEVGRFVERLAELYAGIDERLDVQSRLRLTEVLYSLHAVVALHFAKEEEIYVPLLEQQLSVEQAHSLLQEMEGHAMQHRHGAD